MAAVHFDFSTNTLNLSFQKFKKLITLKGQNVGSEKYVYCSSKKYRNNRGKFYVATLSGS